MNTINEYVKLIEDRKIIKQETKLSIHISFAMLCTCIIFGLIAYNVKVKPVLTTVKQELFYGIANLIVILLFIIIIAIRRTVYYSPKFIRDDFSLRQILQQWRKIDITLLGIAITIPMMGLVMTFLGFPFDQTSHLFIGPCILMFLLMPLGIKVRSRLSILKDHFPENRNI
jgi:hypothetical protein